jgi:hypothetical protein
MSIFICAKVAQRPFHSFPNGVKKNLGATNSLRRNCIIHLNVNKVLIIDYKNISKIFPNLVKYSINYLLFHSLPKKIKWPHSLKYFINYS